MAVDRRSDPPPLPPVPEPRRAPPSTPAQRGEFADAMSRAAGRGGGAGGARDEARAGTNANERANRPATAWSGGAPLAPPRAPVAGTGGSAGRAGHGAGGHGGAPARGGPAHGSPAGGAGGGGPSAKAGHGGGGGTATAPGSSSAGRTGGGGASERGADGASRSSSRSESREEIDADPSDEILLLGGGDAQGGFDDALSRLIGEGAAVPAAFALARGAVPGADAVALSGANTLAAPLTPDALTALLARLQDASASAAGGDWSFRMLGDAQGIETLRLQQAASGGAWRVRVTLRAEADGLDLRVDELQAALARDGHRVEQISVERADGRRVDDAAGRAAT